MLWRWPYLQLNTTNQLVHIPDCVHPFNYDIDSENICIKEVKVNNLEIILHSQSLGKNLATKFASD